MKFVAIVRQVPDAESRIRVQGGRVDLSGVTWILDQMDEYAVEEALRLQERHGGETLVIGVGPERLEEALRTALAMGIDRALHLVHEGFLDPLSEAKALVPYLNAEEPTLVLTGGQQADWDSQALGPALAEALGWPVISWTTALELQQGSARARHDLDEGAEWVEVSLPAVFTTQQGLNEPRYPTLPGIMKAKRKELHRETLEVIPRVELVEQAVQERERLHKILDGSKDPHGAARELFRLLREEAKVL